MKMNTQETEARIKEITSSIKSLQKERRALQEQMIESADTFAERFTIWSNSNLGEKYHWIPNRYDMPVLRKWIESDARDFNRYQHVDLLGLFEEEFSYLFNPDNTEEEQNKFWSYYDSKAKDEFHQIAEEMMANNIKSFHYDW